IGDTVNQASRIEASTKSFGTDMLLSADLADFIQSEYMLEVAGEVEVKGKSKPLKLYKVRGYYDAQKNPVAITTKYSDYEAGHDAKVKISGQPAEEKPSHEEPTGIHQLSGETVVGTPASGLLSGLAFPQSDTGSDIIIGDETTGGAA